MIAAAVHPGTVADQQHLKLREKLSVIGRGASCSPEHSTHEVAPIKQNKLARIYVPFPSQGSQLIAHKNLQTVMLKLYREHRI
jgi:hypothetical protein